MAKNIALCKWSIRCLEDGLEASPAFYAFPQLEISSTDLLERLNREIRRRTSAVGIFLNLDSYTRLVTTYLMEYAEDWASSRAYLSDPFDQAVLRLAASLLLLLETFLRTSLDMGYNLV